MQIIETIFLLDLALIICGIILLFLGMYFIHGTLTFQIGPDSAGTRTRDGRSPISGDWYFSRAKYLYLNRRGSWTLIWLALLLSGAVLFGTGFYSSSIHEGVGSPYSTLAIAGITLFMVIVFIAEIRDYRQLSSVSTKHPA